MLRFSFFVAFSMTTIMTFGQNALLIRNAEIFNGKDASTTRGHVLVEGNAIQKISATEITPPEGCTVIDANGRFLMPGMIDAHYHTMLAGIPQQLVMMGDLSLVALYAGKNAQEVLMRGFTSVRDLGGPSFGLQKAIDGGVVQGPRIWPSGAMISQTAGHGDFRMPYEIPHDESRGLTISERLTVGVIADGADAVLKRTREQLLMGASQIKLMAGGGVSSLYDPLDAIQYTPEEMRAAVQAAENWGTYVTVHAYTPESMRMAIEAGVKCIDHGQLADEEVAKLMAKNGTWWCLQAFLDDEDANPKKDAFSIMKQKAVSTGTDQAYQLAKKYKIKTAWGTDALFDIQTARKQNKILAKLDRWYTPHEILKMVTHDNAELLAMSGERSPYRGKIGVIEEGALADFILIDGNPLLDIQHIVEYEERFVLIVKDGKVFKNRVD